MTQSIVTKIIIAVLSALTVSAGMSACGTSGQPSPSATTFADGQAFGNTATAMQIEQANTYVPNGVAVADLGGTFCARMDPTPGSGNTDDPTMINVGTPWYQGCTTAILKDAVKLGSTF